MLFDNFIVHYGFPARLHSDQGANFLSSLISELCLLAGISKSRTTPYHAMGNDMTERFNQTLLNMLGTLEEGKKADWKSHVASLVHAYNVTTHPSTGFLPYFLMFGHHPKLALDAFLGLTANDTSSKETHEYNRKLQERLSSAYKKASEAAKATGCSNKEQYDEKATASLLQPGDLVLPRDISLCGRQKLAHRWESEPYVIISKPNPDSPAYGIRKATPGSRKTRVLHRNLLLPLRTASDIAQPDTSPRYIIPAKRPGYVAGSKEVPPVEKRIRRKPAWQTSDESVLR